MVTVTHFIPKGTEVFMEYALQDDAVFASLRRINNSCACSGSLSALS